MYIVIDQCGQRIGSAPLWDNNSSSLSRPCVYTIRDPCGGRNGSTPRGMRLALLYVDHECMRSVITVVSELGALLKE